MFQQLAARLQEAIDRLRGRGRITEEDLKGTLREIRRALIEADVNLEVARAFVEEVRERALGRKVLESLTPAEVVLATVYEALKEALGGEPKHPQLKDRNVWFLVGLQGSGKTTTAAKLALYYKGKGRRPLLVAADTQRPAAREQLRVLGEKVGVPVLEVQDGESPESIRRRVEERARLEVRDLVLVDTAGRLQIDERLMEELVRLKAALRPDEVLLVLDAMTGQEALSVAQAFDERVGVTGLVLTKLDGDARGGAALSARRVTGKPIYFAGVSERPEGLEPFYPDRLAGRILGMGDVATLAEKVRQAGLRGRGAQVRQGAHPGGLPQADAKPQAAGFLLRAPKASSRGGPGPAPGVPGGRAGLQAPGGHRPLHDPGGAQGPPDPQRLPQAAHRQRKRHHGSGGQPAGQGL